MWVYLTTKSGNVKVGPIPVSTTEERSCPKECSMRGTDCYARFGPLGMHWKKVHEGEGGRGDNWGRFVERVYKFAKGQVWRHNQAGDLPKAPEADGQYDQIDRQKAMELSEASAHTAGWTYTHFTPEDPHNREVLRAMNARGGMTVNLSAADAAQADRYVELECGPVVCVLPRDAKLRGNKTPGGLPIVVCPAQTDEGMSCAQCQLCSVASRKSVVGFLAHGAASKRLSATVGV